MLYGLMTEEINFSYEGGLYGELIRNRAFKADAIAARDQGGHHPHDDVVPRSICCAAWIAIGVCVATSDDGATWVKPALPYYPFNGSAMNVTEVLHLVYGI